MQANFNITILVSAILALTWISERDAVCANSLLRAANSFYTLIRQLGTLPFEDCGSLYDIYYLNISSCGDIPCEMSRGSVVLVNVIFDDNGNDIKFLKNHVRWIFNAIRTTADITPDPCDGHDECILTIKEGKSYWAKVYVNGNLPVVHGTMLWEAVDEHNKKVICFKVPVTIRR